MKAIHEEVELPDAGVQPRVHPLDLPPARRPFIASWWLSQLTGPTILFAAAVILWAISDNYVTPILVPILVAAAGALSSRYQASEAWAYIPRKRQDHQRRVPTSWAVVRAAISAVALLVGLVLVLGLLAARDLPAAVGAYTVGTGIGVVIIMVVSLLWNLGAPPRLRTETGSRLPQLVRLSVVVAALLYGYVLLSGEAGAPDWRTTDIVIGAVVIIAVQIAWSLIQLIPRAAAPSDQA